MGPTQESVFDVESFPPPHMKGFPQQLPSQASFVSPCEGSVREVNISHGKGKALHWADNYSQGTIKESQSSSSLNFGIDLPFVVNPSTTSLKKNHAFKKEKAVYFPRREQALRSFCWQR